METPIGQIDAGYWTNLMPWRSAFVRSVAMLSGGQGLAMAIPVLTAPILGRLYSPSEYGLLGAFLCINTIFAAFGNLQYAQAIVVQATDQRAGELLAVSLWASVATALLSLLVGSGLIWLLSKHASLSAIAPWLWATPLSTLAAGVSGGLAGLANRRRDYRLMSFATVASTMSGTSAALALGALGFGLPGLLISGFIGYFVTLLIYSWYYRCEFLAIGRISFALLFGLAKQHSSFPLYSLPANVLRSSALSIPNFALTYLGAVEIAGHFSRAQSLLAIPIGLMGTALAQVFQEKVARERATTGSSWRSYKRLLVVLSVFAPVIFTTLALASPWLFGFYLGPKWKDTGHIAQLLAPMMCLRLIAGPLWPLFALYDANRSDYRIALWQFLAGLGLSAAAGALAFPAVWQVVIFSLVNGAVHVVYLVQTYRLARYGRI
jgi:O-antigen/teichoic acid export membrane protein